MGQVGPAGDIYVSDGYGNARVHVFDLAGHHRFSWGESGTEAGQFHLPHGITTDSAGNVYVGEVNWGTGVRLGLISGDTPVFQKFTLG